MNTILYYFTGTGNSLAVARDIAKNTHAELIGIPAAVKTEQTIPKNSAVGIIFPLYAGGLPNIVVEFLKTINLREAGYVFAVTTEGGRMGFPKSQTEKLCRKAGHCLDAAWWIQMPDNYLPLGNPPKEDEQKRMYHAARGLIEEISKGVNNRVIHKSSMGFSGKLMGLAYGMFMKHLPESDKKFIVNPRCNECGTCVKVCPVDNIRLAEGKIEWLHHCEGCLACVHFCPMEAINIGKKTELRDRYHHPTVTVADMKKQKGE